MADVKGQKEEEASSSYCEILRSIDTFQIDQLPGTHQVSEELDQGKPAGTVSEVRAIKLLKDVSHLTVE